MYRIKTREEVLRFIEEQLNSEKGEVLPYVEVVISQLYDDADPKERIHITDVFTACSKSGWIEFSGIYFVHLTDRGYSMLQDMHAELALPRFERFLRRQSTAHGLTWGVVLQLFTLFIAGAGFVILIVQLLKD